MPLQMKQRYLQIDKGHVKGNSQDVIYEWEDIQRNHAGKHFKGTYQGKGPPVGTKGKIGPQIEGSYIPEPTHLVQQP